jgi:hypothetical protein
MAPLLAQALGAPVDGLRRGAVALLAGEEHGAMLVFNARPALAVEPVI